MQTKWQRPFIRLMVEVAMEMERKAHRLLLNDSRHPIVTRVKPRGLRGQSRGTRLADTHTSTHNASPNHNIVELLSVDAPLL